MKKILIYISTILFTIFSIVSCERDDICVDTPITPLLTISFRDSDRSIDAAKRVIQLQVTLLKNNDSVFTQPITTDSIRIPLSTISDTTVFRFTRNVGDSNMNNTASDTLSFSYLRDNLYVNRACGFKTVYSDLNVSLDNDGIENNIEEGNWIQRIEIINTNVNDEPNTHIHLFH